MSARSLKAQGFTLVEILIVVVILGILAAIVIPQFTSASESAKASSLVTQLQSLRSQLELYQLQHNGNYPSSTTATFWDQLTEKTNIAGSTTIATGEKEYGPYLQKEIVNPFTDSKVILPSTTEGGIGEAEGGSETNGFVYNSGTGEIKAVIEATKASNVNLDPADGDVTTYTKTSS